MPVFQLKCLSCGEEFEFMQVRSDDDPFCPKCEATGDRLKRMPVYFGKHISWSQWAVQHNDNSSA